MSFRILEEGEKVSTVKWQCRQCGTVQTTQGLKPSFGSFCAKSSDNRHKWAKVIEKPTKWLCRECGCIQSTNGLRPSVGSFCGRTKDHRHRWMKA